VEITSPFDGVVKELLVQEGEVAKVGTGLCLIEVEEEDVEGIESTAPETSAPPSQVLKTTSPSTPSPEIASGGATAPAPHGLHPLDPNYVPKAGGGVHGNDVLAAPSVRHFARQSGVDLALLMPGSGNGGRVEKRDVEAYLSRTNSAQQSAEKDVIVELGRTRYGMWKAMVKVRKSILFEELY
jgi:2-oxoisovalerate dehydrogenase E2 component (dihydrolipoyl transacylase)